MARAPRQAKGQTQAEHQKRGGGGGKLARSETVTVRLDPKLRYLAELAARKQRRTLSSFVEWAIEDVLSRIELSPKKPMALEASQLWDVDESERFIRLGVRHPELLTFEEQQIWKLLEESWLLNPAHNPAYDEGWHFARLNSDVYPVIREYWSQLMTAWQSLASEQRQWVERTRSDVASGKVYPHIVAQKKLDIEEDDPIDLTVAP